MLQAAIGNGLSFDSFSFCQDDGAASEVDVGRGEVADALVVAAVVVIVERRPRSGPRDRQAGSNFPAGCDF